MALLSSECRIVGEPTLVSVATGPFDVECAELGFWLGGLVLEGEGGDIISHVTLTLDKRKEGKM